MIDRPVATSRMAEPADWLDRVLADDARDHAGGYIDDGGFVANVMRRLPAPITLPAWRKPAIAVLWGAAGIGLAFTLPGVVVDVAREAFKLFAAKPFSLSEMAVVLALLGMGTWTTAIVAWKRT